MGMDKFSEEVRRSARGQKSAALSQIIQQVQALHRGAKPSTKGCRRSDGAEQITQALAQLSEAAQQTVESLRQSNRAIGGLATVVTGMRDGRTIQSRSLADVFLLFLPKRLPRWRPPRSREVLPVVGIKRIRTPGLGVAGIFNYRGSQPAIDPSELVRRPAKTA